MPPVPGLACRSGLACRAGRRTAGPGIGRRPWVMGVHVRNKARKAAHGLFLGRPAISMLAEAVYHIDQEYLPLRRKICGKRAEGIAFGAQREQAIVFSI